MHGELNEQQKRAVMMTEGPLLVVAGPGTGKTLTIVHRIAHLINEGVKPENILAVTFTNRAAQEMKERTEALIGRSGGEIFIGTFHLFGLRMMRGSLSPDFILHTRDDQISLIRRISDLSANKAQQMVERISRVKGLVESADEEIAGLYEHYQSALATNNAFDFDDLILKPIELLQNEDLRKRHQSRFTHIIVDEYQDINPAQYKLVKLLAGDKGNICAVGDADQAIYAFRGANSESYLSFEKDFENARIVFLTQSYRSTATILSAATAVMKNNVKRIEKALVALREKGTRITILSLPDERAEAEAIVHEIETRMGGTMMHTATTSDSEAAHCFSDFAIIFRTNAQVRILEEAFSASGIPYQVIGASRKASPEIDELRLCLKVIANPHDDAKLKGLLSLKFSDRVAPLCSYAEKNGTSLYIALKSMVPLSDSRLNKFIAALTELSAARAHASMDALLAMVLDAFELRHGISQDTLIIFENLAAAYRAIDPALALTRIIDEMALMTPADTFDPRADSVALMTMHMAKGLEFKTVFIAGVEEGIIPYTTRKEDIDVEEERRLFYVGMTRAKDELYLLHSRRRFLYGQRLIQSPSRFLAEIPKPFVEQKTIPDRAKKDKEDTQIGLF